MKKVLLGLFIAGTAYATVGTLVTASEVQLASRPAPTASSFTSSASLTLTDSQYFHVLACPVDTADGIQATGTLQAWVLDERTGRIGRDKLVDLDLSSQSAVTSGGCILFPDQRPGVPEGKLIYATSSLKLTDGGTLLTETLSDGGTRLDGGAFLIQYHSWSSVR